MRLVNVKAFPAKEQLIRVKEQVDQGSMYEYDTCCIGKRSSADLSKAIDSMYQWYEYSRICYAYLHDLPGLESIRAKRDKRMYLISNGRPEWFSGGWTLLQEMIAPSNVRFFIRDWW